MDYVKYYTVSGVSDSSKEITIFVDEIMGGAAYGLIKQTEIISQSANVATSKISFYNQEFAYFPNTVTINGTATEANKIVEFKVAVTFEAETEVLTVDACFLEILNTKISEAIIPVSWNNGAILDYSLGNVDPELILEPMPPECYMTGDRLSGYTFVLDVDKANTGLHTVEIEIVYAESLHNVSTSRTVKYQLLGATGSVPQTNSYATGDVITVADMNATFEDYEFIGWVDIDTIYQPRDSYTVPDRNVVFVAYWREKQEIPPEPDIYTITFDPNGGELTDVATMQTNAEGKLDRLPQEAVRTGYIFTGWSLSASELITVTTNTVFSADTTVYACWLTTNPDPDPPNPPEPPEPPTPDLEEETYQIEINNWNAPNEPLILSGIYIDVEIEIDNRNLKSLERTIMERSDTETPSYGIISNKGHISFSDIDGEVRDYAEQLLLAEGLTTTITLNNTITKAKEVVGVFKTDNWDYDKYSRDVNVVLKDDLEEWQSIVVEKKSFSENSSMLDVYNYLVSKTPIKFKFSKNEQLNKYLKTMTLSKMQLGSETLWGQWNEFCQVCGLWLYKYNDLVVVSYATN